MGKPIDPRDFGRKPYRLTPDQIANRTAAIIFAAMFVSQLALGFAFDQPVLVLVGFIFLVAAVIIAKEA